MVQKGLPVTKANVRYFRSFSLHKIVISKEKRAQSEMGRATILKLIEKRDIGLVEISSWIRSNKIRKD